MRDLTKNEAAEFDGEHEHANIGLDTFCCPHCMETVAVFDAEEEVAKVASCSGCGAESVVWIERVPRTCSAKLPTV